MRSRLATGLALALVLISKINASTQQGTAEFLTPEELEALSNPWKVLDLTKHVDSRLGSHTVQGVDDCGGAASSSDDKLFIFGGGTSSAETDDGFIFDPKGCFCRDLALADCAGCPVEDQVQGVVVPDVPQDYNGSKPRPREELVVVASSRDDGKFYIFGGDVWYNDIWSYDSRARKYSALSNVPFWDNFYRNGSSTPRFSPCGAAVGDKIYFFGGKNWYNFELLNDVIEYDTISGNWSVTWENDQPQCDSPDGMNGTCPMGLKKPLCVTIAGGKILVTGGESSDGISQNRTWLFDPVNKHWDPVTTGDGSFMSRTSGAIIDYDAKQGQVYVVGGGDSAEELAPHAQVLDLGLQASGLISPISEWRWKYIPAVQPAPAVKDACGGAIDGSFYSFSGDVDGYQVLPNMYEFNFRPEECPHDCTNSGICKEFGVCECFAGASGPDCNTRLREFVLQEPSRGLRIGTAAWMSLLAAMSLVMLGCFVLLAKKPAIMASLPYLNVACLTGCALACAGPIITAFAFPYSSDGLYPGLDEAQQAAAIQGTASCYLVSAWYPIAFALAYGPLFAKVKRVSSVFLNKKLRALDPKKIRAEMIAIVGGFLALEVVLILIWFLTSPMEFKWTLNDVKRTHDFYVGLCESQRGLDKQTWVTIFAVINCILLIFGAYEAYLTRMVRFVIDSKLVGFAIYNLSAVSALAIALILSADNIPDTQFITEFVAVSLGVLGILVLLMAPSLKRHKLSAAQVKSLVFNNKTSVDVESGSYSSSPSSSSCDKQRIRKLENRVKELEGELAALIRPVNQKSDSGAPDSEPTGLSQNLVSS